MQHVYADLTKVRTASRPPDQALHLALRQRRSFSRTEDPLTSKVPKIP
jgi:hypothetical protein